MEIKHNNSTQSIEQLIKGNLEEIEAEERSNGVIRNRFETLPRITVLSLAALSTFLDFKLEISIGSHTNTVAETPNKSQLSRSLHSNSDRTRT